MRSHHAGDRAARTNSRQRRVRVHRDVADGGADAAQQVEDNEPPVAYTVFNVVAEDPEVPHVADNV